MWKMAVKVLCGGTVRCYNSSITVTTNKTWGKTMWEKLSTLPPHPLLCPTYHLRTDLLAFATHHLINERVSTNFSGLHVYFYMTACYVPSLLLFFCTSGAVEDCDRFTQIWYWTRLKKNINKVNSQTLNRIWAINQNWAWGLQCKRSCNWCM